MHTVFVMVKCELGHAYDVATAMVDGVDQVVEVHSTSGSFDLLVKCYLPEGEDIGKFVVGRLQTVPGVKDTFTMLTFKAFSAN